MKKIPAAIFFLLVSQLCVAQYSIKGKVMDEANQPLPFIAVVIKSEHAGVLTDTAGNFVLISKDPSPVISVETVGYLPVTKKVNAGDSIIIVLQPHDVLITLPASLNNVVALEDFRVQAFERNTAVKNIPAAVAVLNKNALQRYGNTSFVPAMSAVPGVKMDERSPGSYRLSIRGNLLRSTFGVRNVKVYWNGIPFTDANGNTYLNQVAFNNIGKIEVIKGPSGSMYGAGTGGVVLLSSPQAKDKEKYFLAASSAGSYGLFTANASYNSSGDNANTSLSYSHMGSSGYREQADLRKDVADYTATFFINAKQDVSAHLFYSDLYYQTPGGLTAAELAKDPRKARPAAGIFKSAADQKAALYLRTVYAGLANEYRFSSQWSNTTGVYASHTNFKNPTIRNYERKTEQGAGMRSVFRYAHNTFSAAMGGEYQYSFNNSATYGNRLGVTDTLQYHDEIDSRQFNVFLQADVAIHKTQLTAGVSYNNYHYGLLRVSDVGSAKQSSDFSPQFVPRIAVSQEVSDHLNVYVSASKGYSPPSIDEVHASDGKFNTRLRAETGINYEAGIKATALRNKLWGDVSWYTFGLHNTIVSRRDASGADFYVNAGKTKQRGLELSVNYVPVSNEMNFLRMLKLWGSYTHIHALFSEYQQGLIKFDGNKLTGTSPNVVVAGVDIITAGGIFGNFSYTYTDAIPLNDANTFFATHYNLLYLKAGIRTNEKKKVSAEIYAAADISFNKPYSLGNDLNAAGNRFYNPSAPQQFTVGLRLRFNVD